MADITQDVFTENLFILLKETFEGPGGSAYLDKGAGLFQTLDGVTAEAASRPPCAGGQTIAAHCAHLAYYVRANHHSMMGREQHLDWASSWWPQQVGDREWEELKDRVRREYAALIGMLETLQTWEEQQVGDSMAIVAHTAYHLGAIRHALKNLVQSGGGTP
jgi:DinB family protein